MKKALHELAMIFYLLPLYLIMLLITAGMRTCKYLIGLTAWRWTIDAYKRLHICGEKLSRHIRRVI